MPDPSTNPILYKNELVRRIFAKFEDKLPQTLQNGKAFEYYQQGKQVFGKAKFIYDLLDNVTAILSLSYEFTNHAAIHGQAQNMNMVKKVLTTLDIMRRIADSYLKIKTAFNLNETSHEQSKFEKYLSWLLAITNFICPKRHEIGLIWDIGSMIYHDHQAGAPKNPHVPQQENDEEENFNIEDFFNSLHLVESQEAHNA